MYPPTNDLAHPGIDRSGIEHADRSTLQSFDEDLGQRLTFYHTQPGNLQGTGYAPGPTWSSVAHCGRVWRYWHAPWLGCSANLGQRRRLRSRRPMPYSAQPRGGEATAESSIESQSRDEADAPGRDGR
jgi:hypothetical protein